MLRLAACAKTGKVTPVGAVMLHVDPAAIAVAAVKVITLLIASTLAPNVVAPQPAEYANVPSGDTPKDGRVMATLSFIDRATLVVNVNVNCNDKRQHLDEGLMYHEWQGAEECTFLLYSHSTHKNPTVRDIKRKKSGHKMRQN